VLAHSLIRINTSHRQHYSNERYDDRGTLVGSLDRWHDHRVVPCVSIVDGVAAARPRVLAALCDLDVGQGDRGSVVGAHARHCAALVGCAVGAHCDTTHVATTVHRGVGARHLVGEVQARRRSAVRDARAGRGTTTRQALFELELEQEQRTSSGGRHWRQQWHWILGGHGLRDARSRGHHWLSRS